MKTWFLVENEADYKKAVSRYEEIKATVKGSDEHKEKLLLAFLINHYEAKKWDLPAVDPVEIIKIRMEDFGLRIPADALTKEYRIQA